jgi:hypothetical protein
LGLFLIKDLIKEILVWSFSGVIFFGKGKKKPHLGGVSNKKLDSIIF